MYSREFQWLRPFFWLCFCNSCHGWIHYLFYHFQIVWPDYVKLSSTNLNKHSLFCINILHIWSRDKRILKLRHIMKVSQNFNTSLHPRVTIGLCLCIWESENYFWEKCGRNYWNFYDIMSQLTTPTKWNSTFGNMGRIKIPLFFILQERIQKI